jgi:hypothetical protein
VAGHFRLRSARLNDGAHGVESAGCVPIGRSGLDSTAPAIESPEEFERVLGLGLGRAILFLREHDARPYRDIILRACTRWTGYDQQVEGTRTPYLMTVLDATGEIEWYVEPILASFRASTDRRDQHQLIRLVSELAQDGYAEARTALYERFDRSDTEEPFACASELIEVDGLDGFLYAVDRIGATLQLDPDALGDDCDWLLGHLREDAEERCGKEAVQQALDRAALDRPDVRAYVEALAAFEAEEAAERAAHAAERAGRSTGRGLQGAKRNAPYEQIKQLITDMEPPWSVRGLFAWGERASNDDLTRAAADLLVEQDERRLRAYLEIFRRRAFPLTIDRLLSLVHHSNDQIVYSAAEALSRVEHPRIRELALAIIADPTLRDWHQARGVAMLLSNFAPPDVQPLVRLLRTPREETGYHAIGFAIVDVLEENLSPEVVPVLHLLYERGPCTNCREKAVKLLRRLGALPDWLLEECRYDASQDLRDDADAWARGEEPSEA